MPTESPQPRTAPNVAPTADRREAAPDEAPSTPRQRGAVTARRHKEERRAESLREIRAQTAAGTLVVRQMTPAQHEEALDARDSSARGEGAGGRDRPPGTRPQ